MSPDTRPERRSSVLVSSRIRLDRRISMHTAGLPTRLAHRAVLAACRPACRRFLGALGALEAVQRAKLRQLLRQAEDTEFGVTHGLHRGLRWEEVAERLPVTEYADWQPLIDRQRATGTPVLCHDCDRYLPTSGSTSRTKWIPAPRPFRDELDAALAPWLWDIARSEPRALDGRHYWSLSWMPDDLRRQGGDTDDLELFPAWKRVLMRATMAVPGEIARLPTAEAAKTATLVALAGCPDLAVLSVWSPTFALGLLEDLSRRRELVAELLARGGWGPLSDGLDAVPCPHAPETARLLSAWDGRIDSAFTARLWPALRLLSAWDTASSERWARDLHALLPHARFQGKGLWTTEGVVTLPFRGARVLAATSHFYELRCLETGRILPCWALRAGQAVQPVLSTSSGLWRYALPDRLTVTGFLERTPCLKFEGRLGGVDLVGEKTSAALAQEVLAQLELETSLRAVTLIATSGAGRKPCYVALMQPDRGSSPEGATQAAWRNAARPTRLEAVWATQKDTVRPEQIHAVATAQKNAAQRAQLEAALAARLDALLCASFHYRLARQLGQLDAARVMVRRDALARYREHAHRRGILAGNLKIEPLVAWDDFDPAWDG